MAGKLGALEENAMRTRLPALLCATLLAPLIAGASPDPAFAPLAFLAENCWKGTMPDGKATDEHCFTWVYEGRFLRDRHVVRSADTAIYEGETTYYWNPQLRQLEYFYITAHGGYTVARVAPEGDSITFPAATLVTAGKAFGFRSRWKRVGDDAYEVVREYETEKGWMPVRMEMKRQPISSPPPPVRP
jgi:hypothetical protein